MVKFYRVTFCTKHGRKQFKTHYFCDIEADNIAKAKKSELLKFGKKPTHSIRSMLPEKDF